MKLLRRHKEDVDKVASDTAATAGMPGAASSSGAESNMLSVEPGLNADTHLEARFEDVYIEYLKPVYAFVAYRLIDRADAEDVTSLVFEKAWKAFPRYDSEKGTIASWLFTIARNCLSDHFRNQGRSATLVDLHEGLAGNGINDPEPRLQALEMRRELTAALEILDEREREIVSLKFGGSMNNREIGRLLNISESNTGTILYRSLKKVKNQLEGGIENE